MRYVALKDPFSSDFEAETDMLPLGYGELTWEQIRGNESNTEWRYNFYLSSFPDGITQPDAADVTDEQLAEMSKQAWEKFFDPNYTNGSLQCFIIQPHVRRPRPKRLRLNKL